MNLPEWKITLGTIDVSDLVNNIRTNRKITDYPYIGQTKTGSCEITLEDPVGDFSPSKSSNWWTDNSLDQFGVNVAVKVVVGTKSIFSGIVTRVNMVTREEGQFAILTCLSGEERLRTKTITDFGISRDFRMQLDPETAPTTGTRIIKGRIPTASGRFRTARIRIENETDARNGVYNFRCGINPFSDGSVSIEKASGQNVTIVDSVQEAGVLDPNNVAIGDNEAVSEGEPIPVAENSNYPRMQGKSAYRWIEVSDAIHKLVAEAGITMRAVQTPPRKVDLHATVITRPGYQTVLGDIGQDKYITWACYASDMLIDGDFLYVAMTVSRGRDYFSRILRYDKRDFTWTEYYRFNTGRRQIFNLAKMGDHLVYTATDSRNVSANVDTPVEGSYDSGVAPADRKAIIASIDTTQTTLTETVRVPTTATYPVQLGVYYQFGTAETIRTTNDDIRQQFIVADTRRKLHVHNNRCYYYYARQIPGGIIGAGVASFAIGSTPTRFLFHACAEDNHLHGNFRIRGGAVEYANTFITRSSTEQKSEVRVVRNNI